MTWQVRFTSFFIHSEAGLGIIYVIIQFVFIFSFRRWFPLEEGHELHRRERRWDGLSIRERKSWTDAKLAVECSREHSIGEELSKVYL